MTTIRDMPLDCPEATYVEPVYKEAGMRNFTNLVRTMLNDYGVYHVQFNTINKQTLIDAQGPPGELSHADGPGGWVQCLLDGHCRAGPGRHHQPDRAHILST